jgi:hypothetical protein
MTKSQTGCRQMINPEKAQGEGKRAFIQQYEQLPYGRDTTEKKYYCCSVNGNRELEHIQIMNRQCL